MLEKYDDDHLDNLYALSIIDGWGNGDRLVARICAFIHTTMISVLVMFGKLDKSTSSVTEDDLMPGIVKQKKKAKKIQFQPWSEMREKLGFK